MTEQQYRVIADRDKGDDVDFTEVQIGDRLIQVVVTEEGESDLIRIERPVPTTDMTAMSHETTGFCFCGQMHGQVKDWNEYDWAALRTHQPQHPSVPTREQIAEAVDCPGPDMHADHDPSRAAGPPRIEDMTPGTTFTAVIDGGVQRCQFERVNVAPETSVWKVFEPGTGHYWNPAALDPSTIRDVTPPPAEVSRD